MNIQHLHIIADRLQFKLIDEPPQQIPSGPGGGHLCWKIKSDNAVFCVKQLDPKIDVNDTKAIARYDLCESVAYRFAQHGIPAVYALRYDEKSVIVLGNAAYLVYPWIEGNSLKRDEISAEHAEKIAELLAEIHAINLYVPEIEPKFDIYSNAEIICKLETALVEIPISVDLNQNMILSMNDKYLSAIPTLKEKTVITHGDVFCHNVIWQGLGKPFLIDWEAVKSMDSTRELIRTCVAWSGIHNEPLSLTIFEKMIKTYIRFGGELNKAHVEAALNAMYGSIIFWLLYNIDLACGSNSQERKDAAINEINSSIMAGPKLTKLYPVLMNSIMSCC